MSDKIEKVSLVAAEEKPAASSLSSSSAPVVDASERDDDNNNISQSTSLVQQQQQQFSQRPTAGGASAPIQTLKVIILGDVACGKSSIIARFMYDAYDRHYRATLGIDFLTKLVTVHGQTVKLSLWDTAGQERFHSLIPSYIRNSAGAIVVFDVSNRESFVNTTRWVENVRQERGADSGIVFFLVANKIDLEKERVVTSEEGEAKAREIGAPYIEVSAKTGVNIKALFRKVSTTTPLPDLPAASGGGGVGGGLGLGGIGGMGGIPAVRRLDPLLVTPSRPSVNLAAANNGPSSDDSNAGLCGGC